MDSGCFFECDTDTAHNVNRCLVYNDYTGDVAGGGFFRLADANRAAARDELRFQFFDGEDRIEFEDTRLSGCRPSDQLDYCPVQGLQMVYSSPAARSFQAPQTAPSTA